MQAWMIALALQPVLGLLMLAGLLWCAYAAHRAVYSMRDSRLRRFLLWGSSLPPEATFREAYAATFKHRE